MVVALTALASLLHAPVEVQGVLSLVYALAALLLGAAVPAGSLRLQLAHQRVSRLVAQLHQPGTAGLASLRDLVAEALEDPSLTLHYRRPDSGDSVEYVDLRGRPAPLPRDGRAVTFVGPKDAPLAALAHDPFLCRQPRQRERLDAVVAAARLALENASLYAAQQAHLRGLLNVERSTRLDIQAMLHDGTQHRLSNVQFLVGQARSLRSDPELDARLAEIADELQRAVADLREVTQGVYPSTLRMEGRMGGLAPALDGLVQRSSLPVELDVPRQRWPEHVEDAAFFIVSEAVGNAQRHARATLVAVRVHETNGHLLIEVIDDGAGGATQRTNGSGLRSMRNRAAALAGTLDVNSLAGVGTTVSARLPCE